ncbi:nonsense-mediated mRNA decay protein 3 [Fistulifera solaris]|uniref:60S ribosomal export protein NMD3 n=1 Tax=Fistulifera solaris TaxID=1519565 RepID=A0A1Z5KJ07_FISSO|nr:nonsense-mediated mRNA decay protein 3 [Fistulifera solaris]|eukprot:GAX26082.1 nonsense-mediated mRNA decay protein 3 [Fistulifera solaris]
MEVMAAQKPTATAMMVLCCMCGVPIAPNPTNTCATCLASTSDITRGISTEATLHQCRGCQRWHKEAGKWIACELESRELMSICLGHVSGLRSSKGGEKVRLVDASWIWTEPHSMRLKVRLTVQREVHAGTILQQSFTVVFIVRNQQCIECQAEFRQGSWKSLVQVRQRVSHKRTFLYLEQLILKHGAHRGCLSIETFRDGMDFYFPDKSKAARFISFLENVCPVKIKTSKKLIGTDDKSNISNFKYTNLVEICPLCKDDLCFLPAKTARNLGNISQLVLVKNISNLIHFIDPLTGQTASMTNDAYWRDPIRPLITAARSRMTRYVVLGKEPVFLRKNVSKRSTSRKMKTRLAVLTMAREDDLGMNDSQVEEQSHVGYLLKSGDVCVGYDLKETQFVDDEAESVRSQGKLPDVVVIRKLYGGAATGEANANKRRIWRLQRLDVDVAEANPHARGAKNAAANDEMDEEDFMQEVEADKDMRMNMNLYKNEFTKKLASEEMEEGGLGDQDEDDEDDQRVKLDELLDGLALDDGPDKEDAVDEGPAEMEYYAEGEKASKEGLNYFSREEARTIRDKDKAKAVTGGLSKEFDGF